MFLNQTWDINQYAMGCFQTYGVTIRPHWIPLWSGADKLQASSNIIFSNGELDPWRGGGITKNIGSSIYAIHVEKGAHHLDLRYVCCGDYGACQVLTFCYADRPTLVTRKV